MQVIEVVKVEEKAGKKNPDFKFRVLTLMITSNGEVDCVGEMPLFREDIQVERGGKYHADFVIRSRQGSVQPEIDALRPVAGRGITPPPSSPKV